MNPPASRSRQGLGLVGWLLAVFATAALGAAASVDAPSFYARLVKPTWAPPSGVFGPVWTTLYVAMAVAVWLVWRSSRRTPLGLGLFAAQLVANALWSWLFFRWHLGAWATLEVLVLAALIVATTAAFWRTSRLAALLLVPYLAWVAFASALTYSVWQANPFLL
ncbi:TspO/MBR family protein [Piscinibacter koreensis]|uniref:Tryptophan-rich sensory protein n=1 Tax=Piscinibacter koreensis TaxID=2742824 RepID=A0A7Y6NLG6_9BURK|nr:TspO/MBR family protein [Schlegelella koreensis]NUZ05378.1 tryptophan-rich sensory protein [Schlegelella koreensis]